MEVVLLDYLEATFLKRVPHYKLSHQAVLYAEIISEQWDAEAENILW